jgi:hypothetical protein
MFPNLPYHFSKNPGLCHRAIVMKFARAFQIWVCRQGLRLLFTGGRFPLKISSCRILAFLSLIRWFIIANKYVETIGKIVIRQHTVMQFSDLDIFFSRYREPNPINCVPISD